MKFDSRITAIRKDIASDYFKGLIKKRKFIKGKEYSVISTYSPLYSSKSSKLSTQLLYGEKVNVFDQSKGWSWLQSLRDGYVGYTPTKNLKRKLIKPTHKVISLRTFVYSLPSIKADAITYLSFNSLVNIGEQKGDFVKIKNLGWGCRKDFEKLSKSNFNRVEMAKKFLNTPYLWGGRDSMGIDCSGLIQNIMQINCIGFPRDTDMQETFVIKTLKSQKSLRSGDLVFWKGHVALMINNKNIIHANAFHMKTCIELLNTAKKRISKTNGNILKFGRF